MIAGKASRPSHHRLPSVHLDPNAARLFGIETGLDHDPLELPGILPFL